MARIGTKSRRAIEQQFPDVTWEQSYVVSDESGDEPGIKTLCIYEAPSEEHIRGHAEVLGEHVITQLYEIGGVVTPADFAS